MSDSTTVSRRAPVGGAFLIERQSPSEVLVPEAIGSELRMFMATAKTFVQREIVPDFDQLEALDYELSRAKMLRAGTLGLLGVEVPEGFGGLGVSKPAAAGGGGALAASGSVNAPFQ